MLIINSIIITNSILLVISLMLLHIFHFRGPYTIPFQVMFRYFTRYERFFMRFLFKILKTEFLYKNRLIRFIPEFISYFAANGAYPSVYTLQELERTINILYYTNGGQKTDSKSQFGILLRPCPCRDAQNNYSKKLPNVTDIIFTTNRKALPTGHDNIFISKPQLIRKLRQFDEAGLIHVVLGCCGEDGFGMNICNCHKSACFLLLAVLGRGFRRGLAKGPSIATSDETLCKGINECGKCLRRCPFKARIPKDGKSRVIADRCFGCGLCANTCESGATSMTYRADYEDIYFPLSWLRSK